MPAAAAYKVVKYPHLGMRLTLGKVYTREELETRIGTKDPERKKQLHRKLEDPTLFQPLSPKELKSMKGLKALESLGKTLKGAAVPVAAGVIKKDKRKKESPATTASTAACSSSSSLSPSSPAAAEAAASANALVVASSQEEEKQEVTRRRRIANSVAKSLLEEAHEQSRPVSDQDVLTALRVWGFGKNEQRTNVLPKGKTWVHSDTLGLLRTRSQRTCVAAASRAHPHFTRLLVRWLRNHWPPDVPEDWPFTSISVNKGYAARRHRDRTNLGPSILKAFGSFRGGRVRYWPHDERVEDVEKLRVEDSVVLEVRGDPVPFDGTRAHEVSSFQGERYSLVFFPVLRYTDADQDAQSFLVNEGFNIPDTASLKTARQTLEQAAAEADAADA